MNSCILTISFSVLYVLYGVLIVFVLFEQTPKLLYVNMLRVSARHELVWLNLMF